MLPNAVQALESEFKVRFLIPPSAKVVKVKLKTFKQPGGCLNKINIK